MTDLVSDIVGRVERLPLKPSEINALLPLMEAVSNAFHAVRERFKDEAVGKGRIDINVIRDGEDDAVIGFRIEDNGPGFTEDNYTSFQTPDSRRKMGLGGKGVGRLSWLRVFGGARVESIYLDDGLPPKPMKRMFDFILADENQIRNEIKEGSASEKTGTVIELSGFEDGYQTRCPARVETIVERLIAHFLPTFAAKAAPSIFIHDDGVTDLRKYFGEMIIDQQDVEVAVTLDEDEHAFIIHNMKCNKRIRTRGSSYNWLFLCGHERSVTEQCIDDQIGLKALDEEAIYIGSVTGDFLDLHVNQERDGFTFDLETETAVRRQVATSIREYLADYVAETMALMTQNTQDLIVENPQFIYLNEDLEDFVKTLQPNSAGRKEEIYVSMCRSRFRRQRDFNRISLEIAKGDEDNPEIKEKVDDYMRYVDKERMGALAEYVAKRKAILEFLDTLTGYEDPEKHRHHLEDAVHSLICPMRVDSTALELASHNLWILDDRLAFFNFFASDKQARAYLDTECQDRPDLAFLYDSCLGWRTGEQGSDKVVIVEFKRPGREDYKDEDPVRQALRYVNLMKSGKTFKDSKGHVISSINDRTSFDCYIVADITQGLSDSLMGMPLQPTPDNEGMFGYTDNPKAFVEIIPYAKLLRDAKARNAAFFKELGIDG
ncbi:ATP-binding protein [Magnetospira sp. QH-2]|uniref:ATP-binding protein n=1 Tax=Magnetospira sp. (strain QH-2) TaxID=1288970 RepID=UPI0003E80E00|nr:ATP-binding protein [Magnetospira sp. QH-2]CCQ72412.1 Putative HATPase domain-containing protein [Magnetospira sp. QH-2]